MCTRRVLADVAIVSFSVIRSIAYAKINFINSGAVDIIRTAYYIHGLELMKLIFAVLCVS